MIVMMLTLVVCIDAAGHQIAGHYVLLGTGVLSEACLGGWEEWS